MKPRFREIIIATVGVFAAIAAVWIRWTYSPPPSYYFPGNLAVILPCLLTAGVVAAFGALIPRRKVWRISLWVVAAILLLGVVALPVKPDWFVRAHRPRMLLQGRIPGKPREEFLATIRGIPVFQAEKDYQQMVLPPVRGTPVAILCGDTYSPWLAIIPRNKELTFTVWQTKVVMSHYNDGEKEFYWDNRLETIQDGETVIYDARICPLHHVSMERVEVPVHYGLPSAAFMEASKDFSGGPGFIMGGCVVNDDAKTEMDYRCPICAALYAKWVAQERQRIGQSHDNK